MHKPCINAFVSMPCWTRSQQWGAANRSLARAPPARRHLNSSGDADAAGSSSFDSPVLGTRVSRPPDARMPSGGGLAHEHAFLRGIRRPACRPVGWAGAAPAQARSWTRDKRTPCAGTSTTFRPRGISPSRFPSRGAIACTFPLALLLSLLSPALVLQHPISDTSPSSLLTPGISVQRLSGHQQGERADFSTFV